MQDKERERQLVRLAQKRDSHAFAELYSLVYRDLYRTALYRLDNPEDAENVVSDTILDAYAGIDKLRDENAFRSWIFRILDNKIKKCIKEYVNRRQHETSSVEEYMDILPTKGNVIENAENRTIIEQAFRVLSEEEKEIVTMTVFGEYDSKEIADMMKLNRNTVRSKYSRALVKLREYLSSGGDHYGK